MSRRHEFDFLIACAAPASSFDPARLDSLAEGLDWPRVEALADYHRVRPALYRRALDRNLLPQSLRLGWEGAFRENAVRNLHLTAALIAITKAFTIAGVPVLPHKGPLLALAAYGDLALREFADLDLLVPPEALQDALAVLAEHGYHRDPELAWLSAAALRRWTGEISCVSAQDIAVDLHWRLTPPHYPVQLDPVMLWRHLDTIPLGGAALPTLAPEALLVVLALHGAKHCWEALGWLTDLAWLVEARSSFDWTLAHNLATESGCARTLLLAAALNREVFGTALPDWLVRRGEADPAVGRLRERVLARWASRELQSPRALELLSFADAVSTSRAAALRHVVGLIVQPTEVEWRARRLSERLFFLYAPGRLARLVWKYALKPTRI